MLKICVLSLFAALSAFGGNVIDSDEAFSQSPVTGLSGLHMMRAQSECALALLPGGDRNYKAKIDAIANAKKSVDIQALIFRGDETGWYLTELLIKKHREGVRIRIIVDAMSNFEMTSKIMFWYLRNEGIEVQGYEFLFMQFVEDWFQPRPDYVVKNLTRMDKFLGRWRFRVGATLNWMKSAWRGPFRSNKRYHDKMIVVDAGEPDAVAFTGGLNWAKEYFRIGGLDQYNWRDQDVAVRGAVVDDIAQTFQRNLDYLHAIKTARGVFDSDVHWAIGSALANWAGSTFSAGLKAYDRVRRWRWFQDKMTRAEAYVFAEGDPVDLHYTPSKARFFQSRPRLKETFITDAYVRMIEQAESEVTIVNAYFVPIAQIRDALKQAARRGVKVTIITNGLRTNDVKALTRMSRYYYRELMEAGCQVREWGSDPTESTVHAKFAIFDRKLAFVGSYNLDPRSHLFNSETGMAFESEELAGELAAHVDEKDIPLSDPVRMDDAILWNQPDTLTKRMKLWMSQLVEPML